MEEATRALLSHNHVKAKFDFSVEQYETQVAKVKGSMMMPLRSGNDKDYVLAESRVITYNDNGFCLELTRAIEPT
jgi:hypothetical protein